MHRELRSVGNRHLLLLLASGVLVASVFVSQAPVAASSKAPAAKSKAAAGTKATSAKRKTSRKRVAAPVLPVSANPALTPVTSNLYTQMGSPVNVRAAIGADALVLSGIDGSGIDVAVIDSGVASVKGLDRSGKLVPGFDSTGLGAGDSFGHGTHMAGIIAGNDTGSDADGYRGVAPGARIVPVRVADGNGGTDARQIIAGIDWVIANAKTGGRNIRVLNLSLAAVPLESYVDDPLAVAVERAWKAGIVVVVAAGNAGSGPLASPAYDPFVLTVGALDPNGTASFDDDTLAPFTSGPVDPTARRIDVAAPGVSILSFRSPGSFIDRTAVVGIIDDRIMRGSGTSQAAAVMSGAAALLLQKFPDATPDSLKALVRNTASLLPDRPRSGAGRLRVDRAVAAGVTAHTQVWPAAKGLPTVKVDGLRPDAIKIMSGFAGDAAASTGNTWTGNTWTGNTWTGSSWTGSSWTGSSWTGSSWTGSTWQ